MSDTERLHSWIARASFPEERLRCRAFAAADEQDAVVVEDRCASWEAVFAPGDSAAASAEELAALKTALLRARGLTETEWRDGLRDYVVRAPEYLPAWAATFIELQHRWHAEPCAPAAATAPPGKPHLLLTAVWAECSRAWTQRGFFTRGRPRRWRRNHRVALALRPRRPASRRPFGGDYRDRLRRCGL